MSNKLLILIIIILTCITVLELGLITNHFVSTKNQTPLTISEKNAIYTPTSILSQSPKDNPPFFTGTLGWSTEAIHDPIDTKNSTYIYYDNESLTVPATGKVWVHKSNHANSESFKKIETQKNEYIQNLNKNGWELNVEYLEKEISGIMADGPLGGVVSFVKIENNMLMLLILDGQPVKYDDDGSSPAQINCPCEYELKVTAINPIPLVDLEKYKKED